MKIRHTKSTSGRTHRLTVKAPDTGHFKLVPGEIRTVTLNYREAPAWDDQVQGDLLRKFERQYPGILPNIGIVPGGVAIDRGLDMIEAETDYRDSLKVRYEEQRIATSDPRLAYLRGYVDALQAAQASPGNIQVLLDRTHVRLQQLGG